jgi:hypothetical protein
MNYNINSDIIQGELETNAPVNIFKERSEAAQEIISKKSSFIERWALLIFVSLLTCIAIVAWFIKYPDFITARAVVLGEISPSEIVSGQNGRLISVLVKHKQLVKQGEIIGWLETAGPLTDTISLVSPAGGQLEFIVPFQKNHYIEQGKLLGHIVPANDSYFAQVKLPQASIGKIDTGMKIQLRLNAYPYREAGYLAGKLIDISSIAVDSVFTGTIQLGRGLTTNRNRVIPFKAGLQAEAVIITKETRLLQRLYYSILKN